MIPLMIAATRKQPETPDLWSELRSQENRIHTELFYLYFTDARLGDVSTNRSRTPGVGSARGVSIVGVFDCPSPGHSTSPGTGAGRARSRDLSGRPD